MTKNKHHKYNTSIFLNEDDISYYLLGLLITDGSIYMGNKKYHRHGDVALSLIDRNHLCLIAKMISSTLPVIKQIRNGRKIYRLRLNNKDISKWLIKNECVPNKTKIVKFPKVLDKYLNAFIRGLIDGDGSIGIDNNYPRIRFDSASYSFIKSLCNILKSNYKIVSKIYKHKWIEATLDGKKIKTTTQLYRIDIWGLQAYKLLKIIYNEDRISLNRKKKLALKIFDLVESRGYSEEELMKMDRLPNINNIKWPTDEEVVHMCNTMSIQETAKKLGINKNTIWKRLSISGKYHLLLPAQKKNKKNRDY